LAGPKLNADVAERLALDIRAYERGDVFQACASALAKPLDVFHPRVVAAIDPDRPLHPTTREGRQGDR
jgi:hypothetical protein